MDNALDQFQLLTFPKHRRTIAALRRRKDVRVVGEIKGQIHELYKLENPSLDDKHRFYFQARYLHGRRLNAIGVWVWYPWNKRLVHLLPPKDVQRLRVSRNRYL